MTTGAELENALWRAGLTSKQVAEIMPVIHAYATAQASVAIGALALALDAESHYRCAECSSLLAYSHNAGCSQEVYAKPGARRTSLSGQGRIVREAAP